VLKAVKKM